MLQISEVLKEYGRKLAKKEAFVSEEGTRTYAELSDAVRRNSASLLAVHLQKPNRNGRFVLFLGNSSDFLISFLACLQAGLTAVPVDPDWPDSMVQHVLHTCAPDAIVSERKFLHKLRCRPINTTIVFLGEKRKIDGSGTHQLEKRLNQYPFYISFTSGSTGKPKGIIRNESSWLESLGVAAQIFPITGDDRILACGSLIYSHFLFSALFSIYLGATFYYVKPGNSFSFLKMLKEKKVTAAFVVPPQVQFLFNQSKKHTSENRWEHLQTVVSGGDKIPVKTRKAWARYLPGIQLYEYYGSAELSFVTVQTAKGGEKKPGSVGKAVPGVEISLRSESGRPVQSGKPGELYVRSPLIFSGYIDDGDKNRMAEDGWISAGDIAYQDEEGDIYLIGRKNNLIITGGINVYPQEVEKAVLQHPHIHEACVIGVPDRIRGAAVVLVIDQATWNRVKTRDIKKFLKNLLPEGKRPRKVEVVSRFPYTTSGKIARNEVSALLSGGKKSHS